MKFGNEYYIFIPHFTGHISISWANRLVINRQQALVLNWSHNRHDIQLFSVNNFKHIEAETKWQPFCRHFSHQFSWMKIVLFQLKFHWSLLSNIHLTIIHHWFRLWLGAKQVTSHYLNQRWLSLLMHICVTRPWYVSWIYKIRKKLKFTRQNVPD